MMATTSFIGTVHYGGQLTAEAAANQLLCLLQYAGFR
jgi:hypothetical protein